MAWIDNFSQRDKKWLKDNGIYSVSFEPRNGAPTYVYGIFGKTNAKMGAMSAKSVMKVANAYGKSKYGQHYTMKVSEETTAPRLMSEQAKYNDANLKQSYDDAMTQLSSFYRNSGEYGGGWEYQPKGGSSSNSL